VPRPAEQTAGVTETELRKKSFAEPDEQRSAGSGQAEIVWLEGMAFLRLTLPPGWRWSKDVRPTARTASCQASHTGFMVTGVMGVRMDDGSEAEYRPGELYFIPPGHDAWVVGLEPVVTVDVTAAAVWGKPAT
jgi:hypothetical protein